ncbi:uncharacterized protein N7477_007026 [Penicillium maclennaniae]|uniref:uncharacterized protein n=1 Tax=Penicillium maclennaniae TaxID=1343394 RepID=UPI0025412EE1|nr:uncharacterized protein N7477_007026 [Penicillium maclennaniae]KAJ5668456.1 hypothetical protein N7477_007026 [Penicillium maclennaniae]
MTTRGGAKISSKQQMSEFEISFVEAIEPALAHLDARKIKVAVNAGASDPKKLHDRLVSIIHNKNLNLNVAWIEVTKFPICCRRPCSPGKSSPTSQPVRDLVWCIRNHANIDVQVGQAKSSLTGTLPRFTPNAISAHGALSRRSNKGPILFCVGGTTIPLAHAFVAGHFLECSTYVTGGNFSGFKSLPGKLVDIGFPIAEISAAGDFVVTTQESKDGKVTEDTCKAQLLYEIQGPYYYNPDVVAILDNIIIKQLAPNRVYVHWDTRFWKLLLMNGQSCLSCEKSPAAADNEDGQHWNNAFLEISC